MKGEAAAPGYIAVSKAGRDKGRTFVVLEVISRKDGTFALLCDGDTRKLAKPKLKKLMHIKVLPKVDEELAAMLASGQKLQDCLIRTAIGKSGAGKKEETSCPSRM